MSQTGGPKSVSAKYQRPKRPGESQRPAHRKGENVEWHRIKALMSLDDQVLKAKGISREVADVIGRWLLFKHLTPYQAEAARRYAFIMGRFDRHFTEGRRSARSQSYERAYGEDQELERRKFDGTLDGYEKSAKRARKHYDRLQACLRPYADPATGRNFIKDALDQMCCENIEPPAQYRDKMASVLNRIGKEFGVMVPSRRGRPRKNRGN